MPAEMFAMPFRPIYDTNGGIIPGGQVYFTLTGTNTPSAPYTNAALTTPLENPVVANGVGRLPTTFLDENITYRVRVYEADAVVGVDVPLEEYDPYIPGVSGLGDTITQTSSGDFYAEQGAKIQRLRDRVFVGGAANHNGTNIGAQPDWLTTYLISKGRTFGFQHVAQMAVLADGVTSNEAGNAFLAAARTSTFTNLGNAVGVLGVGVNDETVVAGCGAWGGYFEGFQNADANGPCYGAEIDTINFKTAVDSDPYSQAPTQVVALQIGSGAEFAGSTDATAGIQFRSNGARFRKGIVFGNDSLLGTDGAGTGTAVALSLACGHGIQQITPTSTIGTQMFFTATTTGGGTTVTFSEGATQFANSQTGKTLLQLVSNASYVNFFNLIPGTAGAPIGLGAAGDSADVGIQLTPKGSEYVWFGTWASSADVAVNGYITIKDGTGNLRKLATIA